MPGRVAPIRTRRTHHVASGQRIEPPNLAPAQRKVLHAVFDGRCAACGQHVPLSEMEAAHRLNASQGGPSWDLRNRWPAHNWCHQHGPDAPHAHADRAAARGLLVWSWEDYRTRTLTLWDGRVVLLDEWGGYQVVTDGGEAA
jgi:hypothetical protein